MTLLDFINSPQVWILVPLVWFLTSMVVRLVKMHHRHVERLAMIDRGMHPEGEEA